MLNKLGLESSAPLASALGFEPHRPALGIIGGDGILFEIDRDII